MEFLNKLEIDLHTLFIIVLILVSAILLTRFERWLVNKSFVINSEKIKTDPTRYKFFKNAISFVIWLIAIAAIISMVPKLKTLAITLFAGAGILVAIIGFAAQEAFSNIIGGIFIILFKPFRVGDRVKVGSLDYGIVEDITLRHTIIINFEHKRIIIPNSMVNSETILNDTIEDSLICRFVEIGISYDSDVELATRIIQEEAIKHPLCIDIRTPEQIEEGRLQVEVRLASFGDSSVNLRALVWTNEPFGVVKMHSDINIAIKKRFEAEGVEIPFPYRTLVYKNELPPNAKSPLQE